MSVLRKKSAFRDKRQWKQETVVVDLERFRSDPEFRSQILTEARAAARSSGPRKVKIVGRSTLDRRVKETLIVVWNHMNSDGSSPYDLKKVGKAAEAPMPLRTLTQFDSEAASTTLIVAMVDVPAKKEVDVVKDVSDEEPF